jgi:hypothetical protein
VLAIVTWGCAPVVPAAAGPSDRELAVLEKRVEDLERRVGALDGPRAAVSVAPPAATSPAPSFSCVAKCGTRSTQTTAFKVTFERVTGQGSSVAAAYEDMVRKCDGRIYERIEEDQFIGGEMKSVCVSDAGVPSIH